VENGVIKPLSIVAVMGKTEGNGCVNDFTRDFASTAWCQFLSPYFGISPDAVQHRVALVMSGGTEGVLSPHFTVFTRSWVKATVASNSKRLVLGMAHTRVFAPEEIGRMAQIEATAVAVREAMDDAGLSNPQDVHFVQIKCPLLTSNKVQDALVRGIQPVTNDTYHSMAYSRGASALGVALALREVNTSAVNDASVLHDFSLYSSRASASAGIELEGNVVIVLGELEGAASLVGISHTVMSDAIDGQAVSQLLRNAFGLTGHEVGGRLINLLAKAEASPSGTVRGARHTMLNDSDINATRHARAVVGGVLASVVGETSLYVSGGAEHQGPAGGGPVAAIVRVEL
jgi:cyanuric acid amidohydrolase